jgi:serine/threonine-protein kinase
VLLGVVGVVLLTGALYGWSVAARPENKAGVRVVPADGNCVVSYAVLRDIDHAFQAQVTIANRSETPVPAWSLWFLLNGDQSLSPTATGTPASVVQKGKEVTVTSPEALTVQKVASVQISGKYTTSNAAPLAFKLAGKTCETFVSSKPGEKSRQVQHLSNGTVQLGPVPTTSTPIPGVTIKPNGVAVVKPVRSTKPAATGTPTGTTPAATQTTTGPGPTATTTTTTNPPPGNPPDPTTNPTTTTTTTDPSSASASPTLTFPSNDQDTADTGGSTGP